TGIGSGVYGFSIIVLSLDVVSQTKEAMNTILSDLRTDDYFNIITFSNVIEVWKVNQSIPATRHNVQSAKQYVKQMEASGWTDINGALLAAAELFGKGGSWEPGVRRGEGRNKVPLVIFLTDGEPTSGVTSPSAIINNARAAMGGSLSLFCLGFGDDVDFPLLQRLSLDNRGVARRIYEEADASLQLKGFYDEVASPLLFDVQLQYLDNRVEEVTQTLFPAFFNGSELVVAGRLRGPPQQALRVRLQASGSAQVLELENSIPLNGSQAALPCPGPAPGARAFVQRLWAYHTIQELLQAQLKVDDAAGRRLLREKALALSLRYNFVTPLTSMVVVKPGVDGEAATPTPARPPPPSATPASARRPTASPGDPLPTLPTDKAAATLTALDMPAPQATPGPPMADSAPPAPTELLSLRSPLQLQDVESSLSTTMLQSSKAEVGFDEDWDTLDTEEDWDYTSGEIAYGVPGPYLFSGILVMLIVEVEHPSRPYDHAIR
ncbi:inter-alpha-trypsin inhibitor heavy chain H6-like, partial [Mustelus asterias]